MLARNTACAAVSAEPPTQPGHAPTSARTRRGATPSAAQGSELGLNGIYELRKS
jgi:hypothetical protein